MRSWPLVALLLCAGARAETAACHMTYGGETRLVEASPTKAPYAVPTVQIGSYFLFRLVFEAEGTVKTYVYADRDSGPVPLHQGVFETARPQAGRHGFSGLHFIYEPVRDGELEYWCELR